MADFCAASATTGASAIGLAADSIMVPDANGEGSFEENGVSRSRDFSRRLLNRFPGKGESLELGLVNNR